MQQESAGVQQSVNPREPILLLVVNVAWYFNLHRAPLARAARRAGFAVHVATAADSLEEIQTIEADGFTFHPLKIRRGRWRPIEELFLTWRLWKLHRRIHPRVVHHITIKPVLFGTLAARLARARAIVNAMSGLGFVFTATSTTAVVRRALVLFAYRILFACSRVRVVFENHDDLELFISRGIVTPERAVLIPGAGVDFSRFPLRTATPSSIPLIILPARMLWDKGVREFCEAAAMLRAEGLRARFALVGGLDPENPAAVPKSWLENESRRHEVEWWGHRSDMSAVYAQTTVVCLPSYREGLPSVLIEGAASGCAIVATDVPGCREVVLDGKTGLLVQARDAEALAAALRRLITDQQFRTRLIAEAHTFVTATFSQRQIADSTLDLYRTLLEAGQ